MNNQIIQITTKLQRFDGFGGWHYIAIDTDIASDIKQNYAPVKRGWGSIPVVATIGSSQWETSIFPNKDGTYMLAIKAEIRKNESISVGDLMHISLKIRG